MTSFEVEELNLAGCSPLATEIDRAIQNGRLHDMRPRESAR